MGNLVQSYKTFLRDLFPGFLLNVTLLIYWLFDLRGLSVKTILNDLPTHHELVIGAAVFSPISGIAINLLGFLLFHKMAAYLCYLILIKYPSGKGSRLFHFLLPGFKNYGATLNAVKSINGFDEYYEVVNTIDDYFKITKETSGKVIGGMKSERVFFRSILCLSIVIVFLFKAYTIPMIATVIALFLCYLLVFLFLEEEKLLLYTLQKKCDDKQDCPG